MPTSLALAILRSPFRGRFPARPSGPCSPRVRSQQAARGSSPGDGTRSAVLGQAPHVPLVNGVLDPPFRRDVELGWVRCQVDKHPQYTVSSGFGCRFQQPDWLNELERRLLRSDPAREGSPG